MSNLENVGSGNDLLKNPDPHSDFQLCLMARGYTRQLKLIFSDLVWVGALVAEWIQQIVQSFGHSPQVQGHLQQLFYLK
jgi:hypothetical protein